MVDFQTSTPLFIFLRSDIWDKTIRKIASLLALLIIVPMPLNSHFYCEVRQFLLMPVLKISNKRVNLIAWLALWLSIWRNKYLYGPIPPPLALPFIVILFINIFKENKQLHIKVNKGAYIIN